MLFCLIALSGCGSSSQVISPVPQSPSLKETQNGAGNPSKETPKTTYYTNKQYGLTVAFPPNITHYEKEIDYDSAHAFNPLYGIEFGKTETDFFEADGATYGNMLSVEIFDRAKCASLELDDTENDFCADTKNDSIKGSWREAFRGAEEKGLWFGNHKYLYYIHIRGEGGSQPQGLLSEIKVDMADE